MGVTGARGRGRIEGLFHFPLLLMAVILISLFSLSTIPDVVGWEYAVVLVALSGLANLMISPETNHFRISGEIKRTLLVFMAIQVVLGLFIGVKTLQRIDEINEQIWEPAEFSWSEKFDEFLKLTIGVSESGSLLPTAAWTISFHGVFLSSLFSASYLTSIPSVGLVVAGLLWTGESQPGFLDFLLVVSIIAAIGLEGILSSIKKASGSIAPAVFLGKRRELALLSLALVILAFITPDLRGVTPIEEFWDISSPMGGSAARGRLRFSTHYSFIGKLRVDPSPAFLVSSKEPHLWRGLVFDRYTGREFLVENLTKTIYSEDQGLPPLYQGPPEDEKLVTHDYLLLTPLPGVVLHAYEPRSVKGLRSFGVTESRMITTQGSSPEGLSYQVSSAIISSSPSSLRSEPRIESPDPRYVQVPVSVPARVGSLAQNITRGKNGFFEQVLSIARYLRNMRYDLSVSSIPPGRDAVDYFLFESQRGYCQHFAAAMVVLCRELGVPARAVSGFGSGSFDPETGMYRVLQLHSHTWVEVRFQNYGWVAFDPTPGGVGGPPVPDAVESRTILDGVMPYYGDIQKQDTEVFVTDAPEYISPDTAFRILGRVVNRESGAGIPGIGLNVTLNTTDVDEFPTMVNPKKGLDISMLDTRTSSDGDFSALCMLPPYISTRLSEAEILIVCTGDEFNSQSSISLRIPVRSRTVLSLDILGDQTPLVIVSLTGPRGPLANQEVKIMLDGEDIHVGLTNESGVMTFLLPPDSEGLLTAKFQGNGTLGASYDSFNLDAYAVDGGEGSPGGNWWWVLSILLSITLVSLFFISRIRGGYGNYSISDIYKGMLKDLRSAGYSRRESMTPHEFALWLEERGVPCYKEIRDLTEKYVHATYAGGSMTGEEIEEARIAVERIRNRLHVSRVSIQNMNRLFWSLKSSIGNQFQI